VRAIEGRKIGRTDQIRRALADVFGEFVDRYVAAHKAAAV
jgi:hypothetical protein